MQSDDLTDSKRNFFGLSLSDKLCHRIAVASFFFLLGCGFSCWGSRLSDVKAALGLNDAEFGMVLFSIPVGSFTGMALSAYLVAKMGSKNMLTLAAILYPLSLLSLSLAHKTWILCLGLFIFGICGNLCNISVNTQAVCVEKQYRRSIMATFHGVWSLAGFLGGLASIPIVNLLHATVFEHFLMLYIFSLFVLISMRRYLVEKDPPKPRQSEVITGRKPHRFRLDRYIVILGFIAFCCMATEGTMFDWSVIYFKDVLHAPLELERYGFISFMCCMALGRFVADKFATRFGAENVIKVSGILIASGLSLAVAFPKISTSSIGFALVGFGVSSIVPLCYSLAGKCRTMATGAALTGVSSIGFFGFLMGPPLIGYISEHSNLRWSFTLILFVGFSATFLSPVLKRLNKSDTSELEALESEARGGEN